MLLQVWHQAFELAGIEMKKNRRPLQPPFLPIQLVQLRLQSGEMLLLLFAIRARTSRPAGS